MSSPSNSCPNYSGACPGYRAIDLKWASVKKGSDTNPSTNMPLPCKLGCPASIVIWKREMLHHISQHHPSHVITEVEREVYGNTEKEKAAVLKLFNRK